jgi:hypothetical protein
MENSREEPSAQSKSNEEQSLAREALILFKIKRLQENAASSTPFTKTAIDCLGAEFFNTPGWEHVSKRLWERAIRSFPSVLTNGYGIPLIVEIREQVRKDLLGV